ncbi:hypothetical protein GLX_22300 [Komagataeibacter medellinensis NBRC 3288]|uniref:Uncharacterized protein n=2 Tax=Acetobacteraceae TaxID=433 RepID=G2I134_KOMMN|nr:hypothetical protein GLX_22300 [Komagataeibacter medellinensis NBRC 3288]
MAEAAVTQSASRNLKPTIHQLVISRFMYKTPPNVRLTTPQYAAADTRRQSIGMAIFFRLRGNFQRVILLPSPDGKGRTMTDENRISNAGPNSPANDNEPTDNIQSALPNPAMKARTDALILVLARLLGRQIAREEFERRLGQIANDNDPASRARPEQEE